MTTWLWTKCCECKERRPTYNFDENSLFFPDLQDSFPYDVVRFVHFPHTPPPNNVSVCLFPLHTKFSIIAFWNDVSFCRCMTWMWSIYRCLFTSCLPARRKSYWLIDWFVPLYIKITIRWLQDWYGRFLLVSVDEWVFRWPSGRVAEWPSGRVVSTSASRQCGPDSIPGWESDPGAVSEKGFVPVWATLRPWVGTLT